MRFYFLFCLTLFFACGAPTKKNGQIENPLSKTSADDHIPNDTTTNNYNYSLLFSIVYDRAVVYVQGNKIFDTSTTKKNKLIRYGLDSALVQGKNTIKIELYNDQNVIGRDTSWEIYYELFKEKEPIDFVHEQTKSGDLGLVFERTHEIILD